MGAAGEPRPLPVPRPRHTVRALAILRIRPLTSPPERGPLGKELGAPRRAEALLSAPGGVPALWQVGLTEKGGGDFCRALDKGPPGPLTRACGVGPEKVTWRSEAVLGEGGRRRVRLATQAPAGHILELGTGQVQGTRGLAMARPGGDAQRGPHPRAELGSGAGDPRGAPRRTPTEPEVLTVSRATTRWAGRVPSRLCRPFAAPTAALAGPTRSLGEAGPCPGQHPPFLPGPRAPRGRRGRQGGLGPQRNQPDDGSQPPPTPPEGLTRRHGPQLQTPPGPVQSELPPVPPPAWTGRNSGPARAWPSAPGGT